MNLKPQDVFVLLKLATLAGEDWSYASLALSLGMSASEVHASLKRSMQAGLAINSNSQLELSPCLVGDPVSGLSINAIK
jgi:predicted transcriptional regulator